ncbi:MBL fold metallo-hydrolase [Dictyobacter aurantiacus]|uniref:MBL fold hydrolase n=1 Tax=Dictyobacter aurantiacus TaxID=1936993 RepID=A0A401ZT14_9CHLR|nr:MBL fold metallo-hydrolase [Dictyobacter aurantiacus]GCE10007.1 MBL fold hydrolase [Dictyobacter aurantiacus]
MLLHTFYHEPLAQASYLVGCQATGEALVIDPNRSLDQYIEFAQAKGLRITAVAETHIHADFVSGSRELAQRTGAQLYLSDMGPAEWKYTYAAEAGAILLKDHDAFHIGNILVQALHTPGHTPEHLSFLITDTAAANEPIGLFTGDFIFVGDVGRPDLLERAAGVQGTMEQSARQLFHSLQMTRELPDYLQIWPGHGAGSACGRALGAIPQTTIGYERRFNWAFTTTDEAAFVQAVLEGQPEPPFYFAQMKRVNKVGPAMLGAQALPPQETLEQLQRQLDDKRRVIDTRPADRYADGYIPGTINIPLNGSFLTWAGWLLPYEHPFVLIADQTEVQEAQQALQLIGLDQFAGYLPTEIIQQWKEAGLPLEHLQAMGAAELCQRIGQGELPVIDVRGASEYREGHIHGAINIPVGYLEQQLLKIPAGQDVVVHCQAGARSAIAASILAAHGFKQHINMKDGFAAWEKAGLPVEKERLTGTH